MELGSRLMRWIGTACVVGAALMAAAGASAQTTTPIQVYGAWHCGNDYCTWSTVRSTDKGSDFDSKNHWLVDGNGGKPAVNVVVLSFVNPLKLLRGTDTGLLHGIPAGMTAEVVNYFTSRGVRVMLSIGGITYTDAWNQALAENPQQLAINAAAVASQLGVGIEIDYEENASPKLEALQAFIDTYRSIHPYDATGANPAARLTIDLAAGDRWLIALTQKATSDWLRTDQPVLDYANAMVPARQPRSAADAQANWQEHVDGKPRYAPPIPPLAPAKFTGSLFLVGGKPIAECTKFATSLQNYTGIYVQSVKPKVGTTPGMLGYMFWAAECSGTRSVCTTPPNSCEGGVGVGAKTYNVPLPMPPLRQN